MGDKRNYAALEWVIGEIGDTLNDARQALEAFVEDPRDSARIRFCLTHIHQVHGSLQMVEFHGASLFAEEMEALAEAVMNGAVVNGKEAQEVLMRSLLQLPHYLEQVKTYHDDHPGIVLPLLNDIRAVRKQSYLSETNLFNPDLSSLGRIKGDKHSILADAAKLRQVIKKLREMYQYAAASVLRGIKIDENLDYIDKVFIRMEGVARGTAAYPLWQISAALAEALARDDIELSVAVRGLLRQLARELRLLEENSAKAFNAQPKEALLRNLLFYVARAEDGGRRVAQVKAQYGLEASLFGGGAVSGKVNQGMISAPEPGAIRAVVLALQDELNTTKHLMTLVLSGQGSISDLEDMLPIVKRIGDTLAVLGIGDMRKLTMDQLDILQKLIQSGQLSDTTLIDVAGRLADIEHRLEAIAKGAGKHPDYANVDEREVEIDSAKEAVLTECRAGLERVKELIVDAMSSQWDPSQLPNAVATIRDIEGGLNIVPLARSAEILSRCGAYIEEQMANAKTTPGEELQVLADAIASIDYYLERLSGAHSDDLESYLDLADESLAQLGYGLDSSPAKAVVLQENLSAANDFEDPVPQNLHELKPMAPASDMSEFGAEGDEFALDPKLGAADVDTAEFATSQVSADEVSTDSVAKDEVAKDEVAEDDVASTDSEASSVTGVEFGRDAEITPAPSPSTFPQVAPPSTLQQAELSSDIDDEIIEIFIEEAGEVLETLAIYFPKWQDKPEDNEILTVVRRSFHTLKGSGRMVEAKDVGELAWSVEGMLNRVMDMTVPMHVAHQRLVERVLAFLPSLIDAFKNRTPNPDPGLWSHLESMANALAQGNIPSELEGIKAFEDVVQPVVGDVPVEASLKPADIDGESSTSEDEDENENQILWDIFFSEATTHLVVVDDFVAAMELAAPLYSPPTDALQSALHTLKGSAYMADVKPIATMIAPLESFCKELRSYQISADKSVIQLLKDAASYTRDGLSCIERRAPVVIEHQDDFIESVKHLHNSIVAPLIHAKENIGRRGSAKVDPKLLSLFMSEQMSLLLDADQRVDDVWRANHDAFVSEVPAVIRELQTLSEASNQANLPLMQSLSGQLLTAYSAIDAKQVPASDSLFDVLKPAHEVLLDMVDQIAAGQNIAPLNNDLMQALDDLLLVPTPEEATQLENEFQPIAGGEQSSALAGELESIEVDQVEVEPIELDQTAATDGETIASDVFDEGPFSAGFSEDDDIAQTTGGWPLEANSNDKSEASSETSIGEAMPDTEVSSGTEVTPDAGVTLDNVITSHTEATLSPEDSFGDTVQASEAAGEVVNELNDDGGGDVEQPIEPLGEDLYSNFASVQEDVPHIVDPVETSEHAFDGMSFEPETSVDEEPLIDEPIVEISEGDRITDVMEVDNTPVSTLMDASVGGQTEGDIPFEPEASVDEEPVDEEFVVDESIAEIPVGDHLTDEVDNTPVSTVMDASVDGQAEVDMAQIDAEDFDPEILEIFLEEANELIEELDEAIHSWDSNWEDKAAPEVMKRALHTLKGGARLSGVTKLGDLTHDYESYLIASREPSADFFQNIHQYQDTLLNVVRSIRSQLDGEAVSAVDAPTVARPTPIERSEADASSSDISAIEAFAKQERISSASAGSNILPFSGATEEDGSDIVMPNHGLQQGGAKRPGSQEMIKVSAELLEELVNLAGETSISRGRLEQQVNDLSTAVDEVDSTLRRLNEQLRRLDMETEAQVLFRQEQMAQHEQFDPLEMDRYSQLQQLTRSLMESSSDLVDLRHTISNKLRDTETMLLQQQRINSSLQEGLMRSRMVPFSRLVPRLRRIVRQVSGELGKHVNFELDNVEGEMDRSVLERMVAPLEHMLRNAVDHGIESPEDRQAAEKPETGRILLSLAREGGDILLRLADDGRGIDLKRVREKAIERGLMASDTALSDHDIMQFILQAGFSTAENVTQISGRGVGMDVVAAEIKQLGGSMVIDSKAGVGTQFVVRLPFTVSVNRALMVQLGKESYAIPLNTIEGIVRVSPFELEHYYTHDDARFEYAGENYQVKYLGSIVTQGLQIKLEGQLLPLPVILVRSGQLTMALQVDALSGSREIVVKSLGPQFASVQGISGATVMGDGSVVVILDPHALVRQEMAQTGMSLAVAQPEEPKPALPEVVHQTIMVVDDSVTVRKVTTRFLEREGFNVIVAKDGVDALQVLEEQTPDLMLLDIEMPRMDGFEVAKTMRSTQRWKQVPIIMITSRTGDKHRQHAISIGVNDYMGKPYQEEGLLKSIQALLGNEMASA